MIATYDRHRFCAYVTVIALFFSASVWALTSELPPKVEAFFDEAKSSYYQRTNPGEEAALDALDQILAKLNAGGDIPVRGIISSRSWRAYNHFQVDQSHFLLEIPYQMLERLKSEDQIAAYLLYRLVAMPGSYPYRLRLQEKYGAGFLSEKDAIVLHRMAELGYKPEAYVDVLTWLAKIENGDFQARNTAVRHWLREFVRSHEQPNIRLKPQALTKLQAPLRPVLKPKRSLKDLLNPATLFQDIKLKLDEMKSSMEFKMLMAQMGFFPDLEPKIKALTATASYHSWNGPTRFLMIAGVLSRSKPCDLIADQAMTNPDTVILTPPLDELAEQVNDIDEDEIFGRINDPIVAYLIAALKEGAPLPAQVQPANGQVQELCIRLMLSEAAKVSLAAHAELEETILHMSDPSLPALDKMDFAGVEHVTRVIGLESADTRYMSVRADFGSSYLLMGVQNILENATDPEPMYRVLDHLVSYGYTHRDLWRMSNRAMSNIRVHQQAILDAAMNAHNDRFIKLMLEEPQSWQRAEALAALENPLRSHMRDAIDRFSNNGAEPVLTRLHVLLEAAQKAQQRNLKQIESQIRGIIATEVLTPEPFLNPHYQHKDQPQMMAHFWDLNPNFAVNRNLFEQFIDSESVWIRHPSGNALVDMFKTGRLNLGQLRSFSPALAAAYDQVDRFSGPAYDYDIDHSQSLQMWLTRNLERSGEIKPLDVHSVESIRAWREIWRKLTTRGVTEFTDELAETLYSDDALVLAPVSPDEVMGIFKERSVWNFALRARLWNQVKEHFIKASLRTDFAPTSPERQAQIEADLTFLDQVFPELSVERSVVFEDYANSIAANLAETKMIHAAKITSIKDLQSSGIFVFKKLVETIFDSYRPQERCLEAVRFLVGLDPVPGFLKEMVNVIGETRFRRIVSEIPADLRALVLIHPLIVEPKGLLASAIGRGHVIDMILNGLPEYKNEARLFLEGAIEAIRQTHPFEEPLLLAQLLAFKTYLSDMPIGKMTRFGLENVMGSSGVNIAQILLQREIGPEEIRKDLVGVQDRTRIPWRIDFLEQLRVSKNAIRAARGLPAWTEEQFDAEMRVERILGGGKARLVIKTYENSRPDTPVATKLARPNLEQATRVEISQLRAAQENLNQDRRFRPLGPVTDFIETSLMLGSDNTKDSKNYPEISKLYDGREGQHFKFRVAKPDFEAGISEELASEEYFHGKPVSQLKPDERQRAYADISSVEADILLKKSHSPNDEIVFEGDRIFGNFMAEGAKGDGSKGEIFITDYPLLFRIRAFERDSVIQAFGFLKALAQGTAVPVPKWTPKVAHNFLAKRILAQQFLQHFKSLLEDPEPKAWARFEREAFAELKRLYSQNENANVVQTMNDMLGLASMNQLKLKPPVNHYLIALGNAGGYDPQKLKLSAAMEENFMAHLKKPEAPKTWREKLSWAFRPRKAVRAQAGLTYATCKGDVFVQPQPK